MKKHNTLISLIVPCYNEEETLPIFYEQFKTIIDSIDYDYELIFVDDGSEDKTLTVMKDISLKDRNVIYLSFSRNFGKESAMYAGLCNANGDYVGFMDADMQDPPSLLPKMIKLLKEGNYDSIATRRITRNGESKIRSWFARKFYRIFNKISDVDVVDGARDFRLMKRTMVDSILSMHEYDRFSKGIFSWVGFNTYWLPFENVERVAGKTKWNFFGLFKYAINGIINFSEAPLLLSFFFGTLFIIMSLIIIICAIGSNDLCNEKITLVTTLFVAGIQLLCIGILGQYLGKILLETKNRPAYIVKESNIKKYENH